MKRRTIALFSLLLAGSLMEAAAYAKPTAEITRFEVESLSLRDVTFLFELTVGNPYPLELKFSGMDLDFSVEGSKVFSVAGKGGFSVKAKGKKAQTFTATMEYAAIIRLVKDYTAKDYLDTTIDGTLAIPLPKIPGLPKTVSFDYKLSKKIPAIKPQVAVTGFRVEAPSRERIAEALAKSGSRVAPGKALGAFTDVLAGKKPAELDPAELDVPLTVSYTVEIRNEAKAPIGFDALDYALSVNGEPLVAGSSAKVERRGATTAVTVVNTFSSKKLSRGVKELFVKRKGTFSVTGKASVKLPDEIRKTPVPLAFGESGSFGL